MQVVVNWNSFVNFSLLKLESPQSNQLFYVLEIQKFQPQNELSKTSRFFNYRGKCNPDRHWDRKILGLEIIFSIFQIFLGTTSKKKNNFEWIQCLFLQGSLPPERIEYLISLAKIFSYPSLSILYILKIKYRLTFTKIILNHFLSPWIPIPILTQEQKS